MVARVAECRHANVASHGREPGDPSSREAVLPVEHETGWCCDCARYVQRELDGLAWIIRPGYAPGVWMWRAEDALENSERHTYHALGALSA